MNRIPEGKIHVTKRSKKKQDTEPISVFDLPGVGPDKEVGTRELLMIAERLLTSGNESARVHTAISILFVVSSLAPAHEQDWAISEVVKISRAAQKREKTSHLNLVSSSGRSCGEVI